MPRRRDHGDDPNRCDYTTPKVPGPWDAEPNRLEWRHKGVPCLIVRGPIGALCGYAACPPGHPWHGKGWGDDSSVLEAAHDVAHGGLTFSSPCSGNEGVGICHIPAAGEPADVWWLGFDCGHMGDLVPMLGPFGVGETYKDIAFVKEHAEALAEAILAASAPAVAAEVA